MARCAQGVSPLATPTRGRPLDPPCAMSTERVAQSPTTMRRGHVYWRREGQPDMTMRRKNQAARRHQPRTSVRGGWMEAREQVVDAAMGVAAKVFAGRELRYVAVGEGGRKDVLTIK